METKTKNKVIEDVLDGYDPSTGDTATTPAANDLACSAKSFNWELRPIPLHSSEGQLRDGSSLVLSIVLNSVKW
ncbi:hypothetical protein O9929_12490 [Vibrio lentus]|nr:hypothetical protein [Vibrio lentus]